MSRHLSTCNISFKSMHAFLSNIKILLTDRQTDKQTRAKTFTSSFVGDKNVVLATIQSTILPPTGKFKEATAVWLVLSFINYLHLSILSVKRIMWINFTCNVIILTSDLLTSSSYKLVVFCFILIIVIIIFLLSWTVNKDKYINWSSESIQPLVCKKGQR